MTLQDVLRVKRLADNIHFLRLYYLKSNETLDVIDCIMAIFLFELSRVAKQGSLVTKDQIQFKILDFFTNLKKTRSFAEVREEIREDTDEDICTDDSKLSKMIDSLELDDRQCKNCLLTLKENQNFKTLYKSAVQQILSNTWQ